MRFFDFFAGIGGFRLGMEMAGHECVGHCEIDKYADMSYRAMHHPKETEVFFNDIRTVRAADMPECECYCFGFPCQAFSIAGHRRGFEDTRGTLFFEVMRLAKERQPQILFGENVAGLLNHEGGITFGIIISTMAELGYSVEWQVLNSQNFGVPQHRERIFLVGHLGRGSGKEVFPITRKSEEDNGVKTFITKNSEGREPYQQDRVYDPEGVSPALMQGKSDLNILQVGNIVDDTNIGFKNPQRGRIYDPQGICPSLNTCPGGGLEPKIVAERGRGENNQQQLEKRKDGVTNSLTTAQKDNMVLEGARIRKLTPKECFRLQGFPDEYFERAAEVCSDAQLYKQAGNSVTVNVIYEIAKRLKEE